MLEINSIQHFLSYPPEIQTEIRSALKTKDRLENWLRSQNKKAGQTIKPANAAHWEPCSKCAPWGQPGWVWKEQDRDDNDIHPSQINKCLKILWYACNDYTEQFEEYIDPRLRMIFDIGHGWHNVMQNFYGKRGAWCDPEHYHAEVRIDPESANPDGSPKWPVANDYWIRGSVDGLIDNYYIVTPSLGDVSIRVVHEYKTINSANFAKLNRPKPEHKWQATIYSVCLDVPIVVYVYTNKDDCKMVDFPVSYDHGIWNEVSIKIRRVQELTNSERQPDWGETSAVLNPRECMECAARKFCQPPLRR
jgi:CRISPR/Cas system-associated exonuclease Cas4 (RecB family)